MKVVDLDFDRNEMWFHLPAEMKIAELGVFVGAFAEVIRTTANPQKLWLVDFWKDSQSSMGGDPIQNYMTVLNKFMPYDNIIVCRMETVEFLSSVDELDAVYIDSDHGYQQTVLELEAARNKVSRYICGHDYHPQFGVVQAVNEFCDKYGYTLQLTNETDNVWRSFIIDVKAI